MLGVKVFFKDLRTSREAEARALCACVCWGVKAGWNLSSAVQQKCLENKYSSRWQDWHHSPLNRCECCTAKKLPWCLRSARTESIDHKVSEFWSAMSEANEDKLHTIRKFNMADTTRPCVSVWQQRKWTCVHVCVRVRVFVCARFYDRKRFENQNVLWKLRERKKKGRMENPP